MEQNIKMESHNVDNGKGNWCKRLRLRKGTARCTALEQADITENKSGHQGERSNRKISAPPPPKEHQNQRATDVAEHTPTPQCESSIVSSELKITEDIHKARSLSASPADCIDNPSSGISLPQRPPVDVDSKYTPPQLAKNLNSPHSLNGVFTCVKCKLYTKDINAFLQHKHNVKHEPPLLGDTSQSGDLNSYVSLTSTGFPLKCESDAQKPPKKERKYIWRKKEIQPKVEDSASPGLKLYLTKQPLKANSWMAQGFLSLSGEGMLDDRGLLLNPEKTLEATNHYLERTFAAEKSGRFTIKEELKSISRPVTPTSLLLPKNGTSLPSEPVNPSNNELAVLMERNNISIPPNCTTKVQGFKMVDGKKHLVVKVIPAAEQKITDAVDLAPCDTEGVLSNTTTASQNSDQSYPVCSEKEQQKCNEISSHGTISTYSPPLEVTKADCSLMEKLAYVQCEDLGVCNGPNQGCDDNHCFNQDVGEEGHGAGDCMQISGQELMEQCLSEETLLKSCMTSTASESTCGLLHESSQASIDEAQASVDVSDDSVFPAAEGDSSSESDVGFPVSQSASTLSASPHWPHGDGKEHRGGKEHPHTDDCTSTMDTGESHVPENNAVGSEGSGTAESVNSPQDSDLCIQTPCPQTSDSPCSPDVIAQPVTDLRIVQPLTCPQDAVENPGLRESSPLRTEKAVNNKRPRELSPDRSEEGPTSKSSRDVDSEDGTGSFTEAGCWEQLPRHMEKTLRLIPFSWIQLVKKPQGEQPVVVLNHPDADIPEVANIMRVVHKYGPEVQKVVLSQRTLKALEDCERDGPSPTPSTASPSPRQVNSRNTVKERFMLKLKLRRSGQNAYQVVNTGRHLCLRCWFCGRVFTKQEDFICHGQRHLMEATGDWSSWYKSQ